MKHIYEHHGLYPRVWADISWNHPWNHYADVVGKTMKLLKNFPLTIDVAQVTSVKTILICYVSNERDRQQKIGARWSSGEKRIV